MLDKHEVPGSIPGRPTIENLTAFRAPRSQRRDAGTLYLSLSALRRRRAYRWSRCSRPYGFRQVARAPVPFPERLPSRLRQPSVGAGSQTELTAHCWGGDVVSSSPRVCLGSPELGRGRSRKSSYTCPDRCTSDLDRPRVSPPSPNGRYARTWDVPPPRLAWAQIRMSGLHIVVDALE